MGDVYITQKNGLWRMWSGFFEEWAMWAGKITKNFWGINRKMRK